MKFKQYKAKVFVKLYISIMFVVMSALLTVWAFSYEVDVEREVVGYYERDGSSYYIYVDGLDVRNEEIKNANTDYFKSKIGQTITVKSFHDWLVLAACFITLISIFWCMNVLVEEHGSISFYK